MPRGRRFMPDGEKDGNWFPHRNCDDGRPLEREKSTLTGSMLCAPFRPENKSYPPEPPVPYLERDAKTFKSTNKFSTRDNREKLASDGESFGTVVQPRRIGRKFAPDLDSDLHRSERDFLTHYGRHLSEFDYNTIYSDNYRGCQTTQPATCCRKFPKNYPDARSCLAPESVGCLPPAAASAPDGSDPPPLPRCRATTELLAVTQQPFIRQKAGPDGEKWKYSYHGLPRCYPSGFTRIDKSNPYPGWFLQHPTNSRCDIHSG